MSESKIDCKYWDKCYQKNKAHINKYNHPPKLENGEHSKTNALENKRNRSTSPKSAIDCLTSRDKSKSPEEIEKFHERSRSPILTAEDKNSTNKYSSHTNDDNPVVEANNTLLDKESDECEKINIEETSYFKIFHNTVHNSKKDEYLELLKTTNFIRHKFLVEMPDEFYTFWAFCSSLAETDQKPDEIFINLGLQLVGPFEYLSGTFHNADIMEPGEYLRHWRFYYDPPEFQTIFIKKRSGVHYGYWRDDPSDKRDLLIAKNDVNKGCEFTFIAANCFQALIYFIDHDLTSTPFNAPQVKKIKDSIKNFSNEHNINLENFEDMRRKRQKKVVTKTFHKVGIVVPYDRKTQLGYRPLIETDSNLKAILNKFSNAEGNKDIIANAMDSLQPIIRAANIAVDECDFGTTLELGINLFCSGYKDLHELIVSLLVPGYSMLKRPQFIAIIKAHLEYRRKGNCLSAFETD